MARIHAPRIQNETVYDGRRVAGIVRYVFRHLELDGARIMVKVKHHDGHHAYQGRFYAWAHSHGGYVWSGSDKGWAEIAPRVPMSVDHLLVCRIGKPGIYPRMTHVYDRRDAPDPWEVADWQEALVSITAHEATHLRQLMTKGRGHGRFNESETEWAARRLWEDWRVEQGRG